MERINPRFVFLILIALSALIFAACGSGDDSSPDNTVAATVNGKKLTAAEFRQRYRRPQRGFDNRSPQHVFDMLEQVEQKRSRLGDTAAIVVKYRVNGKELREWRWPPPSHP